MDKLFLLLVFIFPITSIAQFSHESEVATVVTGGNTELETYNAKASNSYKFSSNVLRLNGTYTYGESSGYRSVEKWTILTRYERDLSERLALFIAELVESDRFTGYSRRYNTDVGVKYLAINNDKNKTLFEIGYRYSVEEKFNKSQKDDKDSNARVYAETDQKFLDNANIKLWVEYLHNFTNSDNYLLNIGPSMSVSLNKIFSLKAGYEWNYDNEPNPGNRKHDYMYTTSLIAKF